MKNVLNNLNTDIRYKLYPSVNTNLLNNKILNFIKKEFIPLNNKFKFSTLPTEDFLSKFKINLVKTDKDCGGYFDGNRNILAINPEKNNGIKTTICHELGHYIQFQTEYFEKIEKLISQAYYAEQQAETIGYILYNILYPNEKISTDMFNGYFETDSLKFLIEWYDGYYENDLLIKR